MNPWTWTVLQLMTDTIILEEQLKQDALLQFVAQSLCKD